MFWPVRLSFWDPSPRQPSQPMPDISVCESASRVPPPEFSWTTFGAFFALAAFDSDRDVQCASRLERLGREKSNLEFRIAGRDEKRAKAIIINNRTFYFINKLLVEKCYMSKSVIFIFISFPWPTRGNWDIIMRSPRGWPSLSLTLVWDRNNHQQQFNICF